MSVGLMKRDTVMNNENRSKRRKGNSNHCK